MRRYPASGLFRVMSDFLQIFIRIKPNLDIAIVEAK